VVLPVNEVIFVNARGGYGGNGCVMYFRQWANPSLFSVLVACEAIPLVAELLILAALPICQTEIASGERACFGQFPSGAHFSRLGLLWGWLETD